MKTLGMRSRRPIDATGLFWCLVVLFIASFAQLSEQSWLCILCILASSFFICWQVWRWHADLRLTHFAGDWCALHYPEYTSRTLMDLIIALANASAIPLPKVSPQTKLRCLNWMLDCEELCAYMSQDELHKLWLNDLCRDARVSETILDGFQGESFGEMVQFIVHDGESQVFRNQTETRVARPTGLVAKQ